MSAIILPGSSLSNIIDWVRRIVKTPSDQSISNATIIDYINRFYLYDMPQRVQLFELKRQYTFETVPNIFIYQFPFNNYQMILPPAYCDGVQLGFYQSNAAFYQIFPEFVNNQFPLIADGTNGPFSVTIAPMPFLRGFVDDLGNLLPYVYITTLDSAGNQLYVVDDGQKNLIQTDATFQQNPTSNGPPIVVGAVNYLTGVMTGITFANLTVAGNPIEVQTTPYSAGFPRIMLFFNNYIKLYPVPSRAYKIQIDAYITPAQFLETTDSVPFSYMSEYLARGAARKLLSDEGDTEQIAFYEPFFKEQECNVLRRSERQRATQRTPTIFSNQANGQQPWFYTQY